MHASKHALLCVFILAFAFGGEAFCFWIPHIAINASRK